MVLWQPGDLPRPRARATDLREIAAGKLCALLARSAPRDLFDGARLPALLGDVWVGAGFRRVFVAIAGVLEHPLHRYGREQLERATPERVAAQLGPMLRGEIAPTAKLLVEEAWQAVAPLLLLDDSEREYCDRLQVGDLRPDLLFPDDPAMQQCLASHPALNWKAHNAREHHIRGGRPAR